MWIRHRSPARRPVESHKETTPLVTSDILSDAWDYLSGPFLASFLWRALIFLIFTRTFTLLSLEWDAYLSSQMWDVVWIHWLSSSVLPDFITQRIMENMVTYKACKIWSDFDHWIHLMEPAVLLEKISLPAMPLFASVYHRFFSLVLPRYVALEAKCFPGKEVPTTVTQWIILTALLCAMLIIMKILIKVIIIIKYVMSLMSPFLKKMLVLLMVFLIFQGFYEPRLATQLASMVFNRAFLNATVGSA